MPQISKIRIVNFSYNDGNRFIPDELYNLASPDSGEALNSLFNLTNGGGKTVLVQLIMQPIHPRAKAGGRKIEDYFVRPGDHSFIVLEWNTDGSKEKLLTGIAIAASSSNSADDNQRGNQIKYYTFKTTYEGYSPYSIENLELSRNENGRYVPESFDYIREKAKYSKGVIEHYSSDEAVKWMEMLSEYGIHRIEWEKVIEELNKDEGGLNQYFDKAKTSDKLIAEFFIPAIERKLMSVASKGTDSSLETMLVNYSKKITDKESVIKQRDINARLLENLNEINASCDKLYNANEELVACFGKTYGFKSAISERINVIDTDIDRNNNRIEAINDEISHIELEEKSQKYYEIKESFEKNKKSFDATNEELNRSRQILAKMKHSEDIIQCAKIFEQIQNSKGSIIELKALIEKKENNSEDAEHIASLKYSVYQKAVLIDKELQSKKSDLCTMIDEERKILKSLELTQKELEDDYVAAKEEDNKAEAYLNALKELTDKRIESLQLDISRRLDGFYSKDEIDAEEGKKKLNEKQLNEETFRLEDDIKVKEKRKSEIPAEKAEKNTDIKSTKDELETADRELANYKSLYEKLVMICSKYSLDSSAIFSDSLRKTIKNEADRVEAEIMEANHSKSLLDEKRKAAGEGYLHILPEIKEYVDSTGIYTKTGEEYLCEIIESGVWAKEKIDEILSMYPQIAYALLFNTDKDIQKLLNAGNIDWLPAVVPLYTMEQVNHIFDKDLSCDAFLSICDRTFFADKNGYLERVSKEISYEEERIKRLTEKMQEIKDEETSASCFDYNATWKVEQENRICSLKSKENQLLNYIKELEEEESILDSEIGFKRERLNDIKEEIRSIASWLSSLKELSQMLLNEADAYNNRQAAYVLREKKQAAYDDICKKTVEHKEGLKTLETERERISTDIEHNTHILNNVDGAKEAKVVEDDLEVLYSQYETLLKNMNDDLRTLKLSLDENQNKKEELEKELETFGVDESEYVEIKFSSEVLKKLKEERSDCENKVQSLQEEFNQQNKIFSKSEERLSKAQEELNEFGGIPLPENEIGDSFKTRINNAREEIKVCNDTIEKTNNEKRSLERISYQVIDSLTDMEIETKPEIVVLQDKPSEQWKDIKESLFSSRKEFSDLKYKLNEEIRDTVAEYKDVTMTEIITQLSSVREMMDNSGLKGDRLFTISESISTMISSLEKVNSKIETDLKEIENDFNDIVDQCFLQGKRMYTDLRMIANSSKANIYDGQPQTQMVKMGLPDEKEISEEASRISIKNEIEQGANELRDLIKGSYEEKQILNRARVIVGSERLLHRYIRQDSIPVKVYKIDMNSVNSTYKRWEDTLTQSSGAEKFVVFFSVVLTLMNYTRSTAGFVNKNANSVLVLDNPFGKITSAHLLKPMFDIAKHFNVQLICFSDINKSDVISCFDCVIKLVIKTQSLSNFEIMTHEGNEKIEHGYYKIINDQMRLF